MMHHSRGADAAGGRRDTAPGFEPDPGDRVVTR